jgi:hypothetical protein
LRTIRGKGLEAGVGRKSGPYNHIK